MYASISYGMRSRSPSTYSPANDVARIECLQKSYILTRRWSLHAKDDAVMSMG